MKSLAVVFAGALGISACANMDNESYSADDTQSASETETAMNSGGAWSDNPPDASADAPTTVSGTGAAVGVAASPIAAPASPQEFAAEAVQLAMLTVNASELAGQSASDSEVKAFAMQAKTDHQAIIDRFKAAYPDAVAAQLDVQRNAELAELSGLTGAEFDEEYLDLLDDAHEQAIALYSAVAGDTGTGMSSDATMTGDEPMAEGDADIEEAALIADETLPKLEAHFAEIQRLDAKTDDADDMNDMMESDEAQ